MEKKPSVIICIPTYNEKENVPLIYSAIKNTNISCHILFCDDNSPDGTGRVIDQIVQHDKSVHALHRKGKLGLGTAQRDALEYARLNGYEFAIMMDADLTHDPKFLKNLLEKKEHADVVIGSRYAAGASMHGWSTIRLPFTYFWKTLIRSGLGMHYDCTGAFRLYRLSIFDNNQHFKIKATEFAYGLELLYRLHEQEVRIVETPIKAEQRIHGASKLSGKIMREMAHLYLNLVAERFSKRLFGKPKEM